MKFELIQLPLPNIMDPEIVVPGLAVDREAPTVCHVVEDLDMPRQKTGNDDTAIGGGRDRR